MDIEKPIRAELIDALKERFYCFEEVKLKHALLPNLTVVADVVAFPKDDHLLGRGIAFEVKLPQQRCDHSKWSEAIKQAFDYVNSKVDDDERLNQFVGRRINCSFVFPAPKYFIRTQSVPADLKSDAEDLLLASGAFHLALHLRVGRAFWEKSYPDKKFVLAFGPNDVWNDREGFVKRGDGLLLSNRRIGSRKVDLLSQLERK